ncbi:UDP-glycosyltransferase 83A1-like [Senna tora]|uniref:UDP-glycosyltransferase 83A1-like n=1 Tax=Senna tora TaxID=362788 RepID=A0A834SIC0_9FABA|nr:UDP-glycosyltransferase 83A1-like [Senna tora]
MKSLKPPKLGKEEGEVWSNDENIIGMVSNCQSQMGPLLASKNNQVGNLAESFWTKDLTCLNRLDQQENNSVIYIAFGSFTIFDLNQLQELALGLELAIFDLNQLQDRLPSHGVKVQASQKMTPR